LTGLAVEYFSTTELHLTLAKSQQDSVAVAIAECVRCKCFNISRSYKEPKHLLWRTIANENIWISEWWYRY